MSINLSHHQRSALKRAALNGDYHLLLGAGASRGTRSSYGTPLPMAHELGGQIAARFNIPIESGDLLWRLYARAVDEVGADVIYDWLRSRFSNVEPPTWMDVYARSPWAMVWTLNVDDSFEQAYLRVKSEESRRLLVVNWDEDFRSGNELAVIHLHGCVDTPSPKRLIFSLSEYASAAIAGKAWPLNFRDIYGASPFVVIGARLRDEPDIEAIVSGRAPAHEAPSFYVSPNISPAMERDLRTWNLVPVALTAEAFSSLWPELTGMSLAEPPSRKDELALRVGRQFRELKSNVQPIRPTGHDFIGGDEPIWTDIQENLYAELDWIRQAKQECHQLDGSSNPSSALIYVGRRMTGRSTGLLAIAQELRGRYWRTFLYVADGRPDVDALIRYASDGRAVALLFDSIGDITDDIGRLIGLAREYKLKIACVAVDTVDREATILGRIEEAFLLNRRVGTVNDRLTGTDAARLVDKLRSLGRLGFLEAEKRDRRRLAHFRNSELFDSMAQLENAPGFGKRVNTLVNAVKTDKELELAFIAILASHFGRRLHLMDAGRMISLDSDVVARMVRPEQSAGALLRLDETWVRTRHRDMALKPCIDRLGEHEALMVLGEAMQRSAPRLSLNPPVN